MSKSLVRTALVLIVAAALMGGSTVPAAAGERDNISASPSWGNTFSANEVKETTAKGPSPTGPVAGASPFTVSSDNDIPIDADTVLLLSRDAADNNFSLTDVEIRVWLRAVGNSCFDDIVVRLGSARPTKPYVDCDSSGPWRVLTLRGDDRQASAAGADWPLSLTDAHDQNKEAPEYRLGHVRITYNNERGEARRLDLADDHSIDGVGSGALTLARQPGHEARALTDVTMTIWTRNGNGANGNGASCDQDAAVVINGSLHQIHPAANTCGDNGPVQSAPIPLPDLDASSAGVTDWDLHFVDTLDQNAGKEHTVKWVGIEYRLGTAAPPFSTFIQVGESFAAGHGALGADVGRDASVQACHNPNASNTDVLPITRLAWDFGVQPVVVACGGSQLYAEAAPGVPGLSGPDIGYQLSQLVAAGLLNPAGSNSDVVIVLSSAGNYLRSPNGNPWPTLLQECLIGDCVDFPGPAEFDVMGDALESVYDDIFAVAPDATLVHLGYPQLLGETSGATCGPPLMADGVNFGLTFDAVEVDRVNAANDLLNAEIAERANGYAAPGTGRVIHVDLVSGPDPINQGACTGVHVNPLSFSGSTLATNSFHPTALAYELEYERLAAALGLQPLYTPAPPAPSCALTPGLRVDPHGSRLGASAGLSLPEHSYLAKGTTSVSTAVDVFVPGGGSATVSVLEGGITTFTSTVMPGQQRCYVDARGADRWFADLALPISADADYTTVLVEVFDTANEMVASDASTLTRPGVVTSDNTFESIGIRVSKDGLADIADAIEPVLEEALTEQLKALDLTGSYAAPKLEWFPLDNVDIASANVETELTLWPMPNAGVGAGRLRVIVDITEAKVIAGGLRNGGLNCYFIANAWAPSPIGIQVDLDLLPEPVNGLHFSVANVVVPPVIAMTYGLAPGSSPLCSPIAGAANGAGATIKEAFESYFTDTPLETVLAEEGWVAALNALVATELPAQLQQTAGQLDGYVLEQTGLPLPLSDAVGLGAVAIDEGGLRATLTTTLPGGDYAGPSATTQNALSEIAVEDIAVLVNAALLNQVAGLAFGAAGATQLTASEDPANQTRSVVRLAAPPVFESNGNCAICLSATFPPLYVTTQVVGPGGGWVDFYRHLVPVDATLSMASVTSGPAGLQVNWAPFTPNITAHGLWTHPAATATAGPLASNVAAGVSANLQTTVDGLLGGLNDVLGATGSGPTINLDGLTVVIDSTAPQPAGNLAIVADLSYSAPTVPVPICDNINLGGNFGPEIAEWSDAVGNVIIGTADDDIIFGTSGIDVIISGPGDDWIWGKGGDDVICGGDGSDVIAGEGDADRIFGDSGNDILRGNHGIDYLYGGDGDDLLVGNIGADRLYGNQGNDYLYGKDGADWLYGDDYFGYLNEVEDEETVNALIGGEGADRIYGGAGSDVITGRSGGDRIWGGYGDDKVNGGDHDDIIYGDAGDDKLFGSSGDDDLFGGDGEDLIHGLGDNDFNFPFFDLVPLFETDVDYIDGGPGEDRLIGGPRDDEIHGGSEDDTIFGQDGNDTIHGGSGNDEIHGGNKADDIFGDSGDDEIYGDGGGDEIWGDLGRDVIWGGNGDDYIDGGANQDKIFGKDGNDRLWGGDGIDRLYGDNNKDWLWPGPRYVWESKVDTVPEPGDIWFEEQAHGGNDGLLNDDFCHDNFTIQIACDG